MGSQYSPSIVPIGTAGKDKHSTNSLLAEERSIRNGDQDILQGEKMDEVLAAKMTLINDVGNQYPHTVIETCN
jgi:hypothetical protein